MSPLVGSTAMSVIRPPMLTGPLAVHTGSPCLTRTRLAASAACACAVRQASIGMRPKGYARSAKNHGLGVLLDSREISSSGAGKGAIKITIDAKKKKPLMYSAFLFRPNYLNSVCQSKQAEGRQGVSG